MGYKITTILIHGSLIQISQWQYCNVFLSAIVGATRSMHPGIDTPTSPLHSMAFLFTNAVGEIVFADRSLLRLTKQTQSRASQAQTLHGLLDLDKHAATNLINEVARKRFVYHKSLSIKTMTGSLKPICTAAAAVFIKQGIFIGADLLLTPPSTETSLTLPIDHSDMLNAYLQQALVESKLLNTGTFLQVCATVHIEAIQILLTRVGGPQMRDTLGRIINSTAQQHGIPLIMQDGYLEFLDKKVHFNAHGILLRAAVEYAVDSIGARLVTQEMKTFDRQVGSRLLELTNLKDLLTDDYQ